ncbi:MAG: glycosyltransferase family 2 protein [Candidatus Omnitrophota bacterium]
MKTFVLLPAYNEAKTITYLIKEVKQLGLDAVVVDDGSLDKTAAYAEEAGAIVLKHPENKGKGQAMRTGFDYAIKNNFDAVIIMDSDGQHAPEEINSFKNAIKNNDAGIIVGNRMHNPQGMPWVRKLTNMFMSFFISKLIGYNVPDSQCGFRMIKTDILKVIDLSTGKGKYDTESEILIEAARKGFKIESVPIKTIYTDQTSKIHPVRDTIRFWRLIIKSVFKKNKLHFKIINNQETITKKH